MLKKIKNFFKKYYFHIFIWIVFYSVFLRFYNLGVQSFWIDEWFSSYISMEFFNKNIESLELWYFLHNISQVFSFYLFWVSDFSARFPSLIFSAINIVFIYLISINLFKDKKWAIFATFLFCFLYWEITWARQARFYSLLQLLFSVNTYLIIKIINNFKIIYLNISIIFLYIWILFHPFLYASVVVFLLWISYKIFLERKNLKKFNFKKYLSTFFIIFFISSFEFYKYLNIEKTIHIPWTTSLSEDIVKWYISAYIRHFIEHLGILYYINIFSFFLLWYKKDFKSLIVLAFPFLFIFYIISQKWYLFHTRYVLILYPLILVLSSYFIFYIYDILKEKYKILSISYIFILFFIILFSAKFSFLPKTNYQIDFTSPQPNFKWAYKILEKNSKVISGFPMLCKWYFQDKWTCVYSLAIDYVWDKNKHKKILDRWKDNYTNIAYLWDLDNLKASEKYYFVIDNLSINWIINKEILKNIIKNWKIIFDSWKNYNNIKIIEYSNTPQPSHP